MTQGAFTANHRPTSLRPAGGFTTSWHGAWLALVILSAAACLIGRPPEEVIVYAMAAAAAPGVAGLFVARRRAGMWRVGLIGVWAIAVALAVCLSGGLAGPLAIWMLAPLVAAVVADAPPLIAAAAAMVAVGGAFAALAQAAGLLPQPPASAARLSVFALATFGAAFGSAVIAAHRTSSERNAKLVSTNTALDGVLQAQSALILDLADDGTIRDAFGGALGPFSASNPPASFSDLSDEPLPLTSAMRGARQTGEAEIAFPVAGAAQRTASASLVDRGGRLVAVVRDTTELEAREAALVHAAREARAQNEGKSRFLANMSHELRTPLNAIVGFSDIMRSQMFGPLSAKYAEYASLIHESGGHLLDLINDVLDLSKVEAQRYDLARETFDAREAVSAALRLVRVQADSANVKLRGALPLEPVRIHADRRAVKQIVLNLLSNALKFTPSGGQVTVIMRGEAGELSLIVADNGVGIAPQDLERLGNPYEQAGDAQQRARGSGLGLSLVRAFAGLHGGRMEIQSELGEGTVVSVRLPMAVSTLETIEAPDTTIDPAVEPVSLGENVIRVAPDRRFEH